MGWVAAMSSVVLESPPMGKAPESSSYWSRRHDMCLELAPGTWVSPSELEVFWSLQR